MFDTLSDNQIRGATKQLENLYYGYELRRVAIHIDEIVLPSTYVLESFSKTLGIKHSKQYREVIRKVELDREYTYTHQYDNIWHGRVKEYCALICGADDEEKVVYWKGYVKSVEKQYEIILNKLIR